MCVNGQRRLPCVNASRFILLLIVCLCCWCGLLGCPWFISRTCRNQLAHATHGNTQSSSTEIKAKWESTLSTQGVQLKFPDELKLPGDAALNILRSDQVSNSSFGISFCNSLYLEGKLKVKGGTYLCLLVPGSLGIDMKSMLSSAGPTCLASAFEATLTLFDPIAGRTFLRRVVGINLGLQNVEAAKLSPMVKECKDDSKQLWLHSFKVRNPEEWPVLVGDTNGACKQNVVSRVSKLANCQANQIDMWNFRVQRQDRAQVTAVLMVSAKHADMLVNCKDALLFFRPFIKKGESIEPEQGVTIVWANRCQTAPDLAIIANTLQGVRGFVLNKQSLGVRVNNDCVAPARQALQGSNPRINGVNTTVAGTLRYQTHGWLLNTSAAVVVQSFASPVENSGWQEWRVIPFKCSTGPDSCSWAVKADVEPPGERLILHDSRKIAIVKILSAGERFELHMQEDLAKREAAKAYRRANILKPPQESKATAQNESVDPWSDFLRKQQQSRSPAPPGQSANARAAPASRSDAEVIRLKQEVAVLATRMDKQEGRLDNIEATMEGHRHAVM